MHFSVFFLYRNMQCMPWRRTKFKRNFQIHCLTSNYTNQHTGQMIRGSGSVQWPVDFPYIKGGEGLSLSALCCREGGVGARNEPVVHEIEWLIIFFLKALLTEANTEMRTKIHYEWRCKSRTTKTPNRNISDTKGYLHRQIDKFALGRGGSWPPW